MGGKSQTSTTNQNSTYTPAALSQLQNIYNMAAGAASTPYQPYTGQLTAPLTQTQQNAITGANNAAGIAQPYYTQAGQLVTGASSPLTASQIAQYQSPYTQQVVDATQAQFNQSNAEQQNQLKGNAAIAGALGGDRQAVAQAQLAGQQQTAQAPVIANLYNTGYNNALQTAQQQFQTNPLQSASLLGNLGTGAQSAAEQGVQGQLTAGGTEQQTNQLGLNNDYQQFLQQLAYPYQNAQFLASIGLPASTAMGGTTSGTGTTTSPGPNYLTQALGLGLAGASLFSDEKVKDNIEKIGKAFDGQNIYRFNYKGDPTTRIGFIAQEVEGKHPTSVTTIDGIKGVDYHDATDASAKKGHFASGGSVGLSPFDFINGVSGYVPKTTSISAGAAHQPSLNLSTASSSANSNPMQPVLSGLGGLKGSLGGESYGGGNIFTDVYGGSSSNPLEGLTAADYGTGYADGGEVSFDDRFAPAVDNPFGDMSRGQAVSLLSDLNGGITAPASIGGDDNVGVANPNDPIVLDPAAMDQWRASVDQMQPNLLADNGGDAPVSEPMLPPQITGSQSPQTPPDGALAYGDTGQPMAPTITAPVQTSGSGSNAGYEMGGLNPFNLSDKARQAIIAGGLGMAASRSPFALSAIGEGGLYGLKTLGDLNKAEQDAAQKKLEAQQTQQRIDQEAERIRNQATQFATTSTETHRHNVADEGKDFKSTPIVIGENPDTGMKIYGIFDPNKKTVTDLSGKPVDASTMAGGNKPAVGPDGKPLTGDAYLNTLSAQRAAMAKGIADYKINPQSLSIRGGHREQALTDAARYNPDFDAAQWGMRAKAVRDFGTGPQGNTIRSLDVAIDHLDTLQSAANAMQNGDVKALNALRNAWREQTGSELPGNFDAIKTIVGSEIAKAIVGGQNALHDRMVAQEQAQNAKSPAQIAGFIRSTKQLMAGQLHGLQQQYESTTGLKNFTTRLRPNTIKELEAAQASQGSAPQTKSLPTRVTQNGHTYQLGSDGKYHPVQ